MMRQTRGSPFGNFHEVKSTQLSKTQSGPNTHYPGLFTLGVDYPNLGRSNFVITSRFLSACDVKFSR
jgi:hypothetical protein